jgi:hypothetical protein
LIPATNRCPRKAITPESRAWLALYSHYENGHLFTDGGISHQPALYLEAMTMIRFILGAVRA